MRELWKGTFALKLGNLRLVHEAIVADIED